MTLMVQEIYVHTTYSLYKKYFQQQNCKFDSHASKWDSINLSALNIDQEICIQNFEKYAIKKNKMAQVGTTKYVGK